MTPRLDAIREQHVAEGTLTAFDHCRECGQVWPCDAFGLSGEVERLRGALQSLTEEVVYRAADGSVQNIVVIHGGWEHSKDGYECEICAALREAKS
jgi:hypothetical protein